MPKSIFFKHGKPNLPLIGNMDMPGSLSIIATVAGITIIMTWRIRIRPGVMPVIMSLINRCAMKPTTAINPEGTAA